MPVDNLQHPLAEFVVPPQLEGSDTFDGYFLLNRNTSPIQVNAIHPETRPPGYSPYSRPSPLRYNPAVSRSSVYAFDRPRLASSRGNWSLRAMMRRDPTSSCRSPARRLRAGLVGAWLSSRTSFRLLMLLAGSSPAPSMS